RRAAARVVRVSWLRRFGVRLVSENCGLGGKAEDPVRERQIAPARRLARPGKTRGAIDDADDWQHEYGIWRDMFFVEIAAVQPEPALAVPDLVIGNQRFSPTCTCSRTIVRRVSGDREATVDKKASTETCGHLWDAARPLKVYECK